MRKGKSSTQRDSTQETGEASGSSHRPRGKVGRFLQKVREGAKKLKISRSKDSINRNPVPPNEGASSIPNLEAPSGVEADTKSALQEAQEAASGMHPLSGPTIAVDSEAQGAQEDIVDSFQDTYLNPLRIFDVVIEQLADVWTFLSI
ncbi:hypothetical protein BDR07DRAFT_1383215 [Suillus spraguei]|nr:hypothetical protein BDR07DRAFT_1383215 [Suillus spraguei]